MIRVIGLVLFILGAAPLFHLSFVWWQSFIASIGNKEKSFWQIFTEAQPK